MLSYCRTIVCCGLYLFFTGALFGQPDVHLPPDHPALYSSFCFFAEDFGAWLDAKGVAAPASKTKLTQSAARYLRVDASELPKVITACKSLTVGLRQIDIDAQKYWEGESKNKRAPDAAIVRQFNDKRQAAIQAGIAQLKQAVSTANWKTLQAHITIAIK